VNTDAANTARRVHTDRLLDAVREALRRMRRDGTRVTVRGVARLSGTSRTFLYQNNDARQLLADAVTSAGEQRAAVRAAQHTSSQAVASWRERALNAEDQLRKTHREIHTLRGRVGELMGQLDELTSSRVEDNIQTVNSANTELKQQIRQLTADRRQLEDKLAAARSNNRFLDKRVAALEAQLVEQTPIATPRR
jgi:chromosome segregation ATPase